MSVRYLACGQAISIVPRLFISHASEDKPTVAEPLFHRLKALGHDVWLDKFELTLGDMLSREIDRGLAECDFGVVILSPHFFAKSWPRTELDALVVREVQEQQKRILPVWHDVTREDVGRYSPILAAKLGTTTSNGLDSVVEAIERAVRRTGGPYVNRPAATPPTHKWQISVTAPTMQLGDRDRNGLLFRTKATFVNRGTRPAVLSFQLRFELENGDERKWVAIPEGPMHENERLRVEGEGFATRELVFHFTDTSTYGGRDFIRGRQARLWITDHISELQALVNIPGTSR